MVNEREKKVLQEYENNGWRGVSRGAPDFLFLKVDGERIIDWKFVEVKSQGSALSYEQEIWRRVLEKCGADFKVEVVE